MRYLLFTISLFLTSQFAFSASEDASHLRGINFLYMNIDTCFATEVTASERLDLSEIMELQLRRGEIDAMKSELRELMAEFVTIFRQQNPKS